MDFSSPINGNWVSGPVLGKGATATVTLATSPITGNVFAVKSADLFCSAPLQLEQSFLSCIGRSLHIISYLGFHATPDSYNLFLEFAPGGCLADEIRRNGKGLPECEIRVYARDILMGLCHLHERGVAHCDVKPRNVLLAADGTAKLADLGCARWINGDQLKEAGFGGFNGTPMFMAPEVARGEHQGAEADVWALGCTVVEMATGRPPWPDAIDPVSAVHRIAFSADVPETPKGLLSEEAREFLDFCLKRDPCERWTAKRLLHHPFIADASNSDCSRRSPNWPSPKCVLDQDDFWSSITNEEEEANRYYAMMAEAGQEADNEDAAERLRRLALPASSSAPVSSIPWGDEDWITVRSGSDDDSTAAKCSTWSTEKPVTGIACLDGSETNSQIPTPSPAEISLAPYFSSPPHSSSAALSCTAESADFDLVSCRRLLAIHNKITVPSGTASCYSQTFKFGCGGPAPYAVWTSSSRHHRSSMRITPKILYTFTSRINGSY